MPEEFTSPPAPLSASSEAETPAPPVEPPIASKQVSGTGIRGMMGCLMPVVLVGLLIVLMALLLLRWPAGNQADSAETTTQLFRLLQPPAETAPSVGMRLLDASLYVMMAAGIVLLAIAWRRGARNALVGLVGIAILGLAYASGMALYFGPMVSICGFMLILFGGLIALAASPSAELDRPDEPENRQAEVRTNDHASHSVA
ncbi:MAG: hypothetical protein IT324_00400 [Anaerolineae bacterium]|nr:hypothetical protein [Anaerolineae bacterium]